MSSLEKKTENKRAEQNRAAQRAFRQRKERYIKELEIKVATMTEWSLRMENLEKENEELKRRINELEQQLQTTTVKKEKKLDTLDDLVSILKSHRRPPLPTVEY
ncbi:hypothetical protein G6F56_007369 [Rhizopus delemar]|nr:hypothetical protein G6F56_007369 [Rhizopus delemar]